MKNLFSFFIGFCFNLMLCIVAYDAIPSPANYAIIAGILAYFGFLGITPDIKTGFKGVTTLFGARIDIVLNEGKNWILPKPFMWFIEVDCREKNRDIPITESLSSDNIPMKVDVSAQTKVVNPYKYLSSDKPENGVDQLAERTTRWFINSKESVLLPQEKKILSEKIMEEMDLTTIDRWGIDIVQVFVTDIRLPKDLEDSMTRIKNEEIQLRVEMTELNTILRLLGGGDTDEGRKAWLQMTPEKRVETMQIERDKAKAVYVNGNGGDFTKGAALNQGGTQ